MQPDAYFNYLNSNEAGLVKEREFNNILFKIKLQTPEMLAFARVNNEPFDKKKFSENLNLFKDQLNCFVLIEDEGGKNLVKQSVFNKESYGQILAYGNTNLKDDFKLIQGLDTVFCALAIIEPANSIQPVIRIALSFNGIDTLNKSDLTLIYNDRIFNSGPIKFTYQKTVFENIPEIKL